MSITPEQQLEAATSPETSTAHLDQLIDTVFLRFEDFFENSWEDLEIKIAVALVQNRNTSTEGLLKFVGYGYGHARFHTLEDMQECKFCGQEIYGLANAVLDGRENKSSEFKELLQSEDEFVRCGLAAYKNTPAEILHQLVENEEQCLDVVEAVQQNPNTSVETLYWMFDIDENGCLFNDFWDNFEGIAGNPNCSEELLLDLALTENRSYGRRYSSLWNIILDHPNVTLPILFYVLSEGGDEIRELVLMHPKYKEISREELFNFPNEIRHSMATSESIDPQILVMLLGDPDAEIGSCAQENPRTPNN